MCLRGLETFQSRTYWRPRARQSNQSDGYHNPLLSHNGGVLLPYLFRWFSTDRFWALKLLSLGSGIPYLVCNASRQGYQASQEQHCCDALHGV